MDAMSHDVPVGRFEDDLARVQLGTLQTDGATVSSGAPKTLRTEWPT